MIQITDNVYAVEVPDKSQNFRVQRPYKTSAMCLYYKYGIEEQWNYIKLLPGTWKILCTTREATDKDTICREGESIIGLSTLPDLLTSKGLDPNKNYVLLKKI